MWLLQDKKSGKVAVVDPSEAGPVVKALKERCVQLVHPQLLPFCKIDAVHQVPRHLAAMADLLYLLTCCNNLTFCAQTQM